MMDQVDLIMAYESGEIDSNGIITLVHGLIETGLAWRLQGSYGRAARDLRSARDLIEAFKSVPDELVDEHGQAAQDFLNMLVKEGYLRDRGVI